MKLYMIIIFCSIILIMGIVFNVMLTRREKIHENITIPENVNIFDEGTVSDSWSLNMGELADTTITKPTKLKNGSIHLPPGYWKLKKNCDDVLNPDCWEEAKNIGRTP